MGRKSSKLKSSRERVSLTWKLVLIAGLILVSMWELIPSIRYYALSQDTRTTMDPGILEKLRSKAISLGLDLQGGIHLVMQVDTSDLEDDAVSQAVDQAITVISNRVDQFGLVEPVVQKVGTNRIIIELPGMSDVDRAKELIGRTARLEFKLLKDDETIGFITEKIDRSLAPADTTAVAEAAADSTGFFDETGEQADTTKKTLTQYLRYSQAGGVPAFDMLVANDDVPRVNAIIASPEVQRVLDAERAMLLWGQDDAREDGYRVLYLANATNEITGEMIQDARVSMGTGMEAGRPEVMVENTDEGTREWARITGANVGRRLAIVLDSTVYSAPNIREKIYGGSSSISGSYSTEEARDLAIVLRAGALPASVEVIEDRTVGPSLGADSIRQSRTALIIGFIAVVMFMLVYYLGAGFVAVGALLLNLLFILAYLAVFRATLTLPGMAGIILTMGMAVDANVIIYERIREELRLGNTTRLAVVNGFGRSLWTILDSNITTMLTGIILYNFGTGPIKGFALTLMVGIVSSVFTSLFVSRVVFDILTHKINMSSISMGSLSIFVNAKFEIVKKRYIAYAFSGLLIIVGIGSLIAKGGPLYSIDFVGGNLLELHFDKPITVSDVRDALSDVTVDGTNLASSEIKFIGRDQKDVIIRIINVGDMAETSAQVKTALKTRFADSLPADLNTWVLREEQVGPTIGSELKGKAFWAILWSLILLVIYITIRFEFKFSVGAIIALVHDVCITIALFSLFNKELSLTIIAALLTIVGYSLNDTIVVFDRIREKLRKGIQVGYVETLNIAVNETLSRTIITSLTTLLTVLALFLFGGTVIHDFAFALLIGIGIGTYSSVFVATPLLVEWYVRITKLRTKK